LRVLTYKRTHIGDPNPEGIFGINDCMGSVRDYKYDAVIGVGGIGAEPKSYGIDGKITWVGIYPTKSKRKNKKDVEVTFKHFILLEEYGPLLIKHAPLLAKRLYEGGARVLVSGYSPEELSEAIEILEWSKKQNQPKSILTNWAGKSKGCKIRCCKQCKVT
jgi:hypothetical protein